MRRILRAALLGLAIVLAMVVAGAIVGVQIEVHW